MGEQHVVDAGRVEPEGGLAFDERHVVALQQAAIDEQALAPRFDQLTGAGDTAGRAVERHLQAQPPHRRARHALAPRLGRSHTGSERWGAPLLAHLPAWWAA